MESRGIDYNPTIIFLTIGFLVLAGFIILFTILYRFKVNKHLREKKLMEASFQQTLLQSQIEIQEQTLQHLSRELHDNFGQVASLIKINLNTLQLSSPEKALEKIEATKDLTRQLIADIKSLSVSLGSDWLGQVGLVKSLETEVERLNKTGEFTASFEVMGEIPILHNDKLVILYRMAQEVLNNMVKHSQAKQIKILLHASGNLFILAFSDNGIGFDADKQINASGAGLRNLHNRALLINAQLNIQSLPGKGTTITISLPL